MAIFKKSYKDYDKENKGIKYRIFGAMQRAEIDGYKVGGEFKNLKEEPEE